MSRDPMELVARAEHFDGAHERGCEGRNWSCTCGDDETAMNLIAQMAACIREMVEWRPIETAPHETLVVLGWFEDGVWKQDLGLASAGQRWPTGASNMWWHGSATHWLPLPPAPGAEA